MNPYTWCTERPREGKLIYTFASVNHSAVMRIMIVSVPAEETLAKNQGRYGVSPLSSYLTMSRKKTHDLARVPMNVLESPEIIQSWRGNPSGEEETILCPRKSFPMYSGLRARSQKRKMCRCITQSKTRVGDRGDPFRCF
jgi:hypothetical protein